MMLNPRLREVLIIQAGDEVKTIREDTLRGSMTFRHTFAGAVLNEYPLHPAEVIPFVAALIELETFQRAMRIGDVFGSIGEDEDLP